MTEEDEVVFIRSRGMRVGEIIAARDRNQQTIEGNMVQQEDRSPLRMRYIGGKIDIGGLLTGESKKRWIARWGTKSNKTIKVTTKK